MTFLTLFQNGSRKNALSLVEQSTSIFDWFSMFTMTIKCKNI